MKTGGNKMADIQKYEAGHLQRQQQMAEGLRDFIKSQGLSKNFGGDKDHIFYEGWCFLGQMAGYYATIEEVKEIERSGKCVGYEATAALCKDQVKLTTVKAWCMRDERNWVNKPAFQLASMAQTRAASKAFRMHLSFIVAMAGYQTTPAEEMDGVFSKGGGNENQKTPVEKAAENVAETFLEPEKPNQKKELQLIIGKRFMKFFKTKEMSQKALENVTGNLFDKRYNNTDDMSEKELRQLIKSTDTNDFDVWYHEMFGPLGHKVTGEDVYPKGSRHE